MYGHGLGRLVAVDGDANEFGAGAGEFGDLRHGRIDIGRVGVGHRLHDDGRIAADRDIANPHRDRLVPGGPQVGWLRW